MSEIKTNKISPSVGTTLTLGDTGDTITTAGTVSGFGLFSSYAIFMETHTGDVDGGTSVLNTWTTRILNTVSYNGITSASLSTNQITLPIGNYFVQWASPFANAGRATTRLYDNTAGATVGVGGSNTASSRATNSTGFARITPSVATAYSIDYFTTVASATGGLGYGSDNAAADSTFTIVTIFKES